MPAPLTRKTSPLQSPWEPRGSGFPHLAPRDKGALGVCAVGGTGRCWGTHGATSARELGDSVPSRAHTAHRGSFQRGLCPCGVPWQRAGGPQNPAGLSWGPSCFSHVSGNWTSRKILRFVDKIAKSKYFQKATENEFIKKKMEEVSNTPLLLTVEVQELAGTLAVNIPPPPTDRVWYQLSFPPRAHPPSSSPCSL